MAEALREVGDDCPLFAGYHSSRLPLPIFGERGGQADASFLSCSGQYREKPTLKIFVHLIDRLVHGPGEMLIQLGPCDGKRFWYRTFAVEKYEVAGCNLGIIAALF